MSEENLPCPFCTGRTQYLEYARGITYCKNCGAQAGATVWNNRTPPPGEVEKLLLEFENAAFACGEFDADSPSFEDAMKHTERLRGKILDLFRAQSQLKRLTAQEGEGVVVPIDTSAAELGSDSLNRRSVPRTEQDVDG